MNLILQKEILIHIFKRFGIFLAEGETQAGFIDNLLDDAFITNKKIGFESEDKKKYSNNVWAASATANPTKLKVLVADIHEDIPEYTIIFQMDNMPAYALRLASPYVGETDDPGSAYLNAQNDKWIEASVAVQAKFLYGVEGLSELPLHWSKLDEVDDLYKILIQFLNFYERT